jgi:hypothetical protein
MPTSTIFEKKLSSGKTGVGLESPFATRLPIALPDFVIAVVVTVVACHSKPSLDFFLCILLLCFILHPFQEFLTPAAQPSLISSLIKLT